MYEELVESLRLMSKQGKRYGMAVVIMEQAADAIENISKAYQMMAEAYEAEVTKPRWISVTERLPNKDDDVLIYGEWTGASGAKYREIWLADLKGFLHQGYKPIAWMPLPEPPKEEDNG